MPKSTNTDLIVFSICSVLVIAVMCMFAVDLIIYGPVPDKAPPTYTTSDGLHHECKLAVYDGLIHRTTWTLTCPDGYIQHNGNYTIERP